MSLNIKNPRVHELAREAARVTGKSQTGAIEEALTLLLQERGADPLAAERQVRLRRMREMGERFGREEREPDSGIRSVDDLYDDVTGMPR